MATQLINAKRGNITDEVKFVSESEEIDAQCLREKIAKGSVVILKNNTKSGAIITGIGDGLKTKVAAQTGTTSKKTTLDREIDKVRVIEQIGCDVLVDLSIGNLIDETRQAILSSTRLPLGTNPLLQAAVDTYKQKKDISELSKDKILSTIEKHCMDGVDFISLHCATTKNIFDKLKDQKRTLGITTQSGMILADYIETTKNENPLYEYFDEILEIIKPYDVVLSIGNTLKPAIIEDSNDTVQYMETIVQGELVKRARNYGIQTMVENIGHISPFKIQSTLNFVKDTTHGAPIFSQALICDSTIGYDHINSSIGSVLAGLYGANMFNCTPSYEHIACTTSAQARESVMMARISALCVDLAKNNPKAKKINEEMVKAQIENNSYNQSINCIDKLAFDTVEKQYKTPDYILSFVNKDNLECFKKESAE